MLSRHGQKQQWPRGYGRLGDGAREFDNGPQGLVTDDQAVIRMLTGPSVITGAGALMPDAFFPIHSRATVTL